MKFKRPLPSVLLEKNSNSNRQNDDLQRSNRLSTHLDRGRPQPLPNRGLREPPSTRPPPPPSPQHRSSFLAEDWRSNLVGRLRKPVPERSRRLRGRDFGHRGNGLQPEHRGQGRDAQSEGWKPAVTTEAS